MPQQFKRMVTLPPMLTFAMLSPIHNLAHAQESNSNLRLEEITITAQKRAESMQDVPISVATVDGVKLQQAGIENFEDLTTYLTNVHFTQTGFSTQVRVRGIGSDNSQGFEQSVGMYIDGIHYSRAQLFRAPMFDLEMVELLRGPQGTLFGKNSISGALNLSTRKPTDTLEGYVTFSPEFEEDAVELTGAISGPLTDSLSARLAVRSLERDGSHFNEFKQVDEAETDEKAIRLSLHWEASDDLTFDFKAESNKFETRGRAIEIIKDESLTPGGANFSQVLQTVFSQRAFDSDIDYIRSTNRAEFSDNSMKNITLTGNYEFNDHTLTFTTGKVDFSYEELCDCDFLPIETLPLPITDDFDQLSQEIRITSPSDKRFEWIAGAFYQGYEQEFTDVLNVNPDNLLITALNLPALSDTSNARFFSQESDAWALFGQATFKINEDWRVTVGGRFTEEEKTATKVLRLIQPSTGNEITNVEAGLLYWNVFGTETEALASIPNGGHNVRGERDESEFLPLVNVAWDINPNIMSYLRYTQGYKSGGFDPRSNKVGADINSTRAVDELEHFEFENEDADSYELGMKSFLFNGRLEFNLAAFILNYEDLQISQFDGAVGFNIGNAKEISTHGIEADGRLLISESLSASYGFSWLDFEYDDFKNGNCYVGETPDGIDTTGDGVVDSCDYTGRRGVYTPEFTVNLTLDHKHTLSADYDLMSSIDMQYIDEQQVHVNQDPAGLIDAYTLVNARIGLQHTDWSVALRAKNLFDEEIISYSANAPLASRFGANTQYGFIRSPRTVYLDFRVNF